MVKTQPTETERKLATLLIGVDTLYGGDALHPRGGNHMIADTWFSGMTIPPIYNDTIAYAARDFSQDKPNARDVLKNPNDVNIFVAHHNLLNIGKEIMLSPDASDYAKNLTTALDVMLRAAIDPTNPPPFEEKYHAATANLFRNVELADVKEAREKLKQTLAGVGYEVRLSRNLRETFIAW